MDADLVPEDSKTEKQRPQYRNLFDRRTKWLQFFSVTAVIIVACLIGNVLLPWIHESRRPPPPTPGRTSYPPADWAYVDSLCDRLNRSQDLLFNLGEHELTRSKDWKSTGRVQCLLVNDPATSLARITYLEVTISEVDVQGSPLKALKRAGKRYRDNGFEEAVCQDGAQCWRKSGDADTPAVADAQFLPYEVHVAVTEQADPPGQSQQRVSEHMDFTAQEVLDRVLDLLTQSEAVR